MKACILLLLGCVWVEISVAGAFIDLHDPRTNSDNPVHFLGAEINLVSFDFESVDDAQQGKNITTQIHQLFLKKIRDLAGGAIITFRAPALQITANYRSEALAIARKLQAQWVLWGRVLLSKANAPLIRARLMLIEPPPGVSASFIKQVPYQLIDARKGAKAPVQVTGTIQAPVEQLRVDFNIVQADVIAIAYFLSGLARYYKGAVRDKPQAKRWLLSSIDAFAQYIVMIPAQTDRSAVAQAHLYLARAYIRLAKSENSVRNKFLEKALRHSEQAAKHNPFDAEAPTVKAVVLTLLDHQNKDAIRTQLVLSVRLAPASSNNRLNLAVTDTVEGRIDKAVQQLKAAEFIEREQKPFQLPNRSVGNVKTQSITNLRLKLQQALPASN